MAVAARPPLPPDLPRELEMAELAPLAHDARCLEFALADVELADQQARGLTLAAARLTRLDLSGCGLDELTATDVEIHGGNLANLHSRGARVTRMTVAGSRLTGLRLSEAELRDLTIRDCRADLASFGGSRLERVTFEGCLLSQADFLDAQLESVRFHRCDLTGADFRGARLRRCEFRRCELTDLQGVASLRGAAMEWPDIVELAGVWAAALGIGVLDPD